jgi:glycosyltransferase involved in cell wall biosynthesis
MTDDRIFPSLPRGKRVAGGSVRPLRVCIATAEILGPSKNGGIATAYFALAAALSSAGHSVTVLCLQEQSPERSVEAWQPYFRERRIELLSVPAFAELIEAPRSVAVSYSAYCWLRTRRFDVIHFPDLQGHGYYAILAKHQGLDFHDTTICVGLHSPLSWIRQANREAPLSPDELEMDFMERESIRLADVAVSPSQYLLAWLRNNGWALPPRCYVQQNIYPPELIRLWQTKGRRGELRRAGEFVFFGRMEERKGVKLFCDALDQFSREEMAPIRITFLGKNATIAGEDSAAYVKSRAERWSLSVQVVTDLGHEAALRFLRESDERVAVMPYLEDNLPYTVLECLGAGIPFLASRVGGIPELIADEDLERITFAPALDALVSCLRRAARDGVLCAQPKVDPAENRSCWLDWHASLISLPDTERISGESIIQREEPLVSVCLSCRDPLESLHALTYLENQDWTNLEVILVDCRTKRPENELQLPQLYNVFRSKGWRIVRGDDSCLLSERDAAAAQARGEYLLFMNEDDWAKPDEIGTFVRAAENSGADILTCFLDLFAGKDSPEKGLHFGCCVFLGAAILPGLFRNYFGQSNIFIKKSAFERMRGFGEEHRQQLGAVGEDWAFLARAALTGFKLEVVPRALAWRRVREGTRPDRRPEYYDHLRILGPYVAAMPHALKNLPQGLLAMNLHYERQYGLARVPQVQTLSEDELFRMTVRMYQARLAANSGDKIALLLNAWLEFAHARSNMPVHRLSRMVNIGRQLMKGRYHRFAHGFGSALRDLRNGGPQDRVRL